MSTPEGDGRQDNRNDWSAPEHISNGIEQRDSHVTSDTGEYLSDIPNGRRRHNGHAGSNGATILEEAVRDTEEFIEREIEESPELGFRVARRVAKILVSIPVAGKIIETTAKLSGNLVRNIYNNAQERKLDKIVAHPKSLRSKISRRTIIRHGFQEAMPNWFERLEVEHPKASKYVTGAIRSLKLISLNPLLTFTIGIPGTPFQVPNPVLQLIFHRSIPFLVNQGATVALNTGKVLRALGRRELLGVIAYGVPGALDTFLPFFNTVLFTPAIDKAIGKHYGAQAEKFLDKAEQKIITGNGRELARLIDKDMHKVGRHYRGILGVSRSEITLAALEEYFVKQEQELQATTPAPVLRDVSEMSWIRSVVPKVQNKLATIEYTSRENRRLERIEAGKKIKEFIRVMSMHAVS